MKNGAALRAPKGNSESLRTRIKVCGITDLQEAHAIVALGVDALGFIFAKGSLRRVEPEKVREIVRSLPPFVDAVGVFVDEDSEVVSEIIQYCGLTMAQLHGSESPAYCADFSCRVVKAFRLGSVEADLPDYGGYSGVVSGFLLDTYDREMAGGTGKTFDWRIVEANRPPGPVILAGGLDPGNVAEAVRQVRPFAVDLNSGVEIEPGRKSIAKVREAVLQVWKTDLALNEEP